MKTKIKTKERKKIKYSIEMNNIVGSKNKYKDMKHKKKNKKKKKKEKKIK